MGQQSGGIVESIGAGSFLQLVELSLTTGFGARGTRRKPGEPCFECGVPVTEYPHPLANPDEACRCSRATAAFWTPCSNRPDDYEKVYAGGDALHVGREPQRRQYGGSGHLGVHSRTAVHDIDVNRSPKTKSLEVFSHIARLFQIETDRDKLVLRSLHTRIREPNSRYKPAMKPVERR